jgi:ABC-type lipoprotein release transport system permease subunit
MSARAHFSLVDYAFGALGRRPRRTAALVGGLATTVALLLAVLFATSSLAADAERARGVQPDIVVQRLSGGRPTLIEPELASFVPSLAGVKSAEPRVWGYVFLPSLQANVTVVGRRASMPDLSNVAGALASGRDIAPGERGVAVVGHGLARLLRVQEGDVIAMPSAHPDAPALTIVGIFDSSVALYASDVLVTSQEDARIILDCPPGLATDIAVELHNPEEATVVARAISEKAPGVRIVDKRLLSRAYRVMYGRRAGIVIAAALPALLAMLILAWDRMAGLGGAERSEIAVQKAVGWSTADVLYAKLYESCLVGAGAALVGMAFAYAWVFLLGAPGLRQVLAGWSVLYPETPLTPAIDAADLLGVLAATVAPFVAVSILPAWRAAITDPMEGLRR